MSIRDYQIKELPFVIKQGPLAASVNILSSGVQSGEAGWQCLTLVKKKKVRNIKIQIYVIYFL